MRAVKILLSFVAFFVAAGAIQAIFIRGPILLPLVVWGFLLLLIWRNQLPRWAWYAWVMFAVLQVVQWLYIRTALGLPLTSGS
jgi:hypothetical protein